MARTSKKKRTEQIPGVFMWGFMRGFLLMEQRERTNPLTRRLLWQSSI
jgi:hypothetical protein